MEYPALTISFNGKFSSVGILLTFNMMSGDYAKDINIKWYDGTTLLSEEDFVADDVRYFCSNYVRSYNRIILTFKTTSRPYRPVFLTRIDYGIYRDFLDDELLQTECLQEINAISENISVNTLSFTVRTKSNIPFDLQKKQRLGLYFDGKLLGNFYLKIFGGEDFNYYLDPAYANTTLTGYIPYTTKRNALVQIAFAIGAVVDTSNSDHVSIYPQQTEVTAEFSGNDTFTGLTLEHSDIVTGIRLTVHSYQESSEEEEL